MSADKHQDELHKVCSFIPAMGKTVEKKNLWHWHCCRCCCQLRLQLVQFHLHSTPTKKHMSKKNLTGCTMYTEVHGNQPGKNNTKYR